MADLAHPTTVPAALLQALAESDADLAAGRIVDGEAVMQDLRAGLARLAAKPGQKAAPRD